MENGYELFVELLNLYCKDKIRLEEFYKLQNLLNKILEENKKYRKVINKAINKLKEDISFCKKIVRDFITYVIEQYLENKRF